MKRGLFITVLILISTLFITGNVQAAKDKDIVFYSKELNISQEDTATLINYADEKQVDFKIVYGLLYAETGGTFNHQAVGPKTRYGRAYGIAQFMENTAPWIASMAQVNYKGKEDLFNASYSIRLAIMYLSYLQYGGEGHTGYYNWHATLTAYNRGTAGLNRYIKNKSTPVSSYSQSVLKYAQ